MKKLKELLNKRSVSLDELAKATGVTRQTLYNIVYGKTKPSIMTVNKICDYFDVDYRDFDEKN